MNTNIIKLPEFSQHLDFLKLYLSRSRNLYICISTTRGTPEVLVTELSFSARFKKPILLAINLQNLPSFLNSNIAEFVAPGWLIFNFED